MKLFNYTVNGIKYQVEIIEIDGEVAQVEVNGTRYDVQLEKPQPQSSLVRAVTRTPKSTTTSAATPAPAARTAPTAAPATPASAPAGGGGTSPIVSPLPGVILRIEVKEGDAVKRGQRIMVLEAMKMENDIKAHKDGTIASINVKEGDSIMEGAALATIS